MRGRSLDRWTRRTRRGVYEDRDSAVEGKCDAKTACHLRGKSRSLNNRLDIPPATPYLVGG